MLFKRFLKKLAKLDYIVTVENGHCIVKEKGSEEEYLTFPSGAKIETKEKLLADCYFKILSKKEESNNQVG